MEFCYRRKLPHWRQDQVTYFVTWRLARGREELDASERDLVVAAIKSFDGQRYQLAAYVVMDDHVHMLLRPFAGYELKAILHSWKSFTARQMQREHGRFGGSGRTSLSTGSFAMMGSLPRSLITLSEIPGSSWPELGDYPWVWPLDR